MRWASRRRLLYISGVVLFLVAVVGVPAAVWLYEPPACNDGVQNNDETAIDKGGSCPLLDERYLIPHAVEWARSFPVRHAGADGGTYNAVAYIENPNEEGGVREAPYRFRLYDENNVLVAERQGSTFIMPGQVTPVFEGGIQTGNRVVSRSYFEFSAPLVWERLRDLSGDVRVENIQVQNTESTPRVTASARNISISDLTDVVFVAVVFDPAGNALAASQTILLTLPAGESREVVFTWPEAFARPVGRVDVTALIAPVSL